MTGGVPERPKGADCKSAGGAYGGSNPPPSTIKKIVKPSIGGSSSVARASAFQAEGRGFESRFPLQIPNGACGLMDRAHVAQSVEHILGKDEVTSSILVVGSS